MIRFLRRSSSRNLFFGFLNQNLRYSESPVAVRFGGRQTEHHTRLLWPTCRFESTEAARHVDQLYLPNHDDQVWLFYCLSLFNFFCSIMHVIFFFFFFSFFEYYYSHSSSFLMCKNWMTTISYQKLNYKFSPYNLEGLEFNFYNLIKFS